jgi:hypothetical protein
LGFLKLIVSEKNAGFVKQDLAGILSPVPTVNNPNFSGEFNPITKF